MREGLRQILRAQWEQGRAPSHAGLAHERWAWPKPEVGTEAAQSEWEAWLSWLERFQAPEGYGVALQRWRQGLEASSRTRLGAFQSVSRLLVGHGNPSGTEVGLTLHHTWGVPVLPGSALKGLTAHYVKTVYGPLDPAHPEPERAPYGGGLWDEAGRRLERGPGAVYRQLFGAPELEGNDEGAGEGQVLFHDALWIPAPEAARGPLVRDVLTVHQRRYYSGEKGVWPNDYDAPNPVAFLTVAPETRFLVALEVLPGEGRQEELLTLAWGFLQEALKEWGVGGKGAAGYGRLEPVKGEPPSRGPVAPQSPMLAEFKQWLEEEQAHAPQRETLKRVETAWLPRLVPLSAEERAWAMGYMRRHLKSPKLREQVAALGEKLGAGGSRSGSS